MLTLSISSVRQHFDRHRSRIELLYRYLTGQGLLQVLNVLNGFLLLRWLSIDEQAKFSLALGLQTAIALLGDLGFGGSLLGLIGTRTSDKIQIGEYVAGIRYYKNRFLIGSFTVGTFLALVYYQRQHWGYDFILIYILILISAQAQSSLGYYSALLQLKQNLKAYYWPQLVSSGARLLVSFLLFTLTDLSALWVVALTTAGFVLNVYWMKRVASNYFTDPKRASTKTRHEIVKLLLPIAPMVLYFALQGQLNTFLIGFFGKAQNIAEVGALNRLGQLFSLLTPFTSVVLLPYFARSRADQIIRRSVLMLMAGVAITLPLLIIAYVNQSIFMWLLGKRFNTVQSEIGLFMSVASINYVAGVVWAIIVARKLNTWHFAVFSVIMTLIAQVIAIVQINLDTTHGVVLLSLYSSLASLVSNLIIYVCGIKAMERPNVSVKAQPVESTPL